MKLLYLKKKHSWNIFLLPAFPWGLRRQQPDIKPPHFTVISPSSFFLGEAPWDSIQDPQSRLINYNTVHSLPKLNAEAPDSSPNNFLELQQSCESDSFQKSVQAPTNCRDWKWSTSTMLPLIGVARVGAQGARVPPQFKYYQWQKVTESLLLLAFLFLLASSRTTVNAYNSN